MKREKKIKKIADQILELERKISLGHDAKSSEQKIEKIMCSLSLEEMLEVDDYITSQKIDF